MAQSSGKKQVTLHKYFGATSTGEASMPLEPPAKKKCPYSGIKLFSEEEIKKSNSGLDNTFKKFWNKKIVEIGSDDSCKKLLPTAAAIKGAVYTDWTLEKTSLLDVEADEIRMNALKVYPKKKDNPKLAKMLKNVSNMKKKHDDLIILYERSENDAIAIAGDDEIDMALKELKKAQDTLKKSITRRKFDIDQLQLKVPKQTDIPENEIALTDSEVNKIVEVIKDDHVDSESDIDIC